MEDWKKYEIDKENNVKRNKKYLEEFENYLIKDNLSKKTVNKHINNIDFYINTYLNHYNITKVEDGAIGISLYLLDWYPRKVLFSSPSTISGVRSSIKKFYTFMFKEKYIDEELYENMLEEVKTKELDW